MTLSFSFHDKIFEPVSLPGNSLYINTRERHTGLYATFYTVVNHAWNATAQKMFLSFIIIRVLASQEKRLLKCISFLFFNRRARSGIWSSIHTTYVNSDFRRLPRVPRLYLFSLRYPWRSIHSTFSSDFSSGVKPYSSLDRLIRRSVASFFPFSEFRLFTRVNIIGTVLIRRMRLLQRVLS